jgi:hypothetical protein
MLKFEYDPNKSQSNLDKHGIDFIEAQRLWEDDFIEIPVQTEEEQRFIVIGKLKEKHSFCCHYLSRKVYTHYFSS